jgi:hypothetical protein
MTCFFVNQKINEIVDYDPTDRCAGLPSMHIVERYPGPTWSDHKIPQSQNSEIAVHHPSCQHWDVSWLSTDRTNVGECIATITDEAKKDCWNCRSEMASVRLLKMEMQNMYGARKILKRVYPLMYK